MRAKNILSLVIVISIFLIQVTFAAPPRYEIIDLGTYNGGWSVPCSINDYGQVVGWAVTNSVLHATLFDTTGCGNNIDLGTLGGDGSCAMYINENGWIVGFAQDNSRARRATLFDPKVTCNNSDLGTLGGGESQACSINSIGQILGWAENTAGHKRATLFDSTGNCNNIDLGTLGGNLSYGRSINSTGQIVGWAENTFGNLHATLFDSSGNANNIDLGTLGGDSSSAHSINEGGQIVGDAGTNSSYLHATLFDPTGKGNNIDLGTLGGVFSVAHSINESGQIVGNATDNSDEIHATLFDPSGNGNNINLNTLINPDSGWHLANASSINNHGWIVGAGDNPNGDYHAYLLIPVTPKIIYVDDNASGANDGSSWADAYNYLQDALSAAWSGDEIYVAQGIYTPDSNSADPNGSGDRTATFQLINGVTLKGGYAGFGKPDPDTCDVDLYKTILSGDLDSNDIDIIYINEPWDLSTEPTRSENSYHVITGSGTDETAILDGFNIASGNANGRYNTHESLGGGMYTDSGGATVMNCTFKCNSARSSGGGVYSSSGVLKLINCTFQINVATDGGGMQNQTSDLTLINCIFRDNTGTFRSGGMDIRDSNATLVDCTFSGNNAGYSGGGLYSINSNTTLTNCIFIGNWTPWPDQSGGGVAGGLGIYSGKAIVTDCFFSSNSARLGGGMVHGNADITINNCIFSNNLAVYISGGIANCSSTVPAKITNCIFSGNSAGYGGGGISNCEYGGSSILTNCTFSGNSAHRGGAINNESFSSATLTNCILWDNTASSGPQVEMEKSSLPINYCCIEDGQAGIYDPYDGLVWGPGNIDADPCFISSGFWEDPCNTPDTPWDDVWFNGDYHLKSQVGRWDAKSETWVQDDSTSLCIDAGDPMGPIGLEPFPNGGRVNMGAYGGTAEASKSYFGKPPCETIVAGDVNGDCVINFLDFRIMALHWCEDNRQ